MQWRGPYTAESRVGANDYRVKMGSKMKTYHVNMLKKYISREPEGKVVPVDDIGGATVAVAGVIHQDVNPELGEVPDLDGYRQREGVCDVKLGDELPEDQQGVLKDLVRRYPDVFTDMLGETDVIQHQIRLTGDMPIRCKPYPLPYAMREELRNEVDTMLVRALRKILEGMPGVGSYIDDIVIYSDSWEDHLRMLKELFGRLRKDHSSTYKVLSGS